jgi:hypothetical protein
MSTLVLASDVLAKSGEAAKSGPIGFAVILVLCIACYFLFKSMSRHLKHVREEFPDGRKEQPPAEPKPAAESPAAGSPAAGSPAKPAQP